MNKRFLCLVCVLALSAGLYAEAETGGNAAPVPLTLAFHDIGWNFLNSFACNYGLNFVGAGLGTWAFIETGLDWNWRNAAYNNAWLADSGIPALYVGYVVPVLTPLIAYTAGRFRRDEKLQITGLALAQSLIITLSIQASLKMITGRTSPGIVMGYHHTRDSRRDDFSGEFNFFNANFIDGWPSGHTANAFAAAAAIAEIYHDNFWLKFGAYSYASLIGIGVSLNVHWASEVLAGALIGYAVGKTVGKSLRRVIEKRENDNPPAFYFTGTAIGVILRI